MEQALLLLWDWRNLTCGSHCIETYRENGERVIRIVFFTEDTLFQSLPVSKQVGLGRGRIIGGLSCLGWCELDTH